MGNDIDHSSDGAVSLISDFRKRMPSTIDAFIDKGSSVMCKTKQ